MKKIAYSLKIIFICFLIVQSGCEPAAPQPETKNRNSHLESQDFCICTSFAPVKIEIMPLTEITFNKNGQNNMIKTYISLLDSFNCQSKWPGIFRFELYKRVLRSTEPKGKRLVIWPDIDLTQADSNNKHWRDFLRAYEFDLELESVVNQDCILQVTCLSPNNKRLTAELVLRPQQSQTP